MLRSDRSVRADRVQALRALSRQELVTYCDRLLAAEIGRSNEASGTPTLGEDEQTR